MKKSKIKEEQIDFTTGEIPMSEQEVSENLEKLNKVIYVKTRRKNGTLRVQQDFSNCPTMAEQHTGHLTDLNYLIKRYKPDELAAYIAARNQYRKEILGHDFTQEPSLQEGLNVVAQSKANFEALPDKIKSQFSNHLEFLKFIDNPANEKKLVELGIISQQKLDGIKIEDNKLAADKPKEEAQPKSEAKGS